MEHAPPLYAHIIFCANPALMDAKTLISSLLLGSTKPANDIAATGHGHLNNSSK